MKIRAGVLLVIFLLVYVTVWAYNEHEVILPDLPGQIALVGRDYNIHILQPGAPTTALTQDAAPGRRYQWPTWSTDGRVAYFCCDTTARAEVFVSSDSMGPGRLLYTADNARTVYAYWSPQHCPQNPDCRSLAVLLENHSAASLNLLLIRDDEEITAETVASGAPLFYSWSPAGTQMAMHRGSSIVEVFDLPDGTTDTLTTNSGIFRAPAWSPVDDRVLYGVVGQQAGQTDMIIQAHDTFQTLLPGIEGAISFSWSPDGNHIAYRSATAEQTGRLQILDPISGQIVARSGDTGVLAFFWSPDSEYIAYLTLSTPPGTFNLALSQEQDFMQNIEGLAWSVLHLRAGTEYRYSTFVPTSEMLYLLLFFDQFNQSHRLWSPDSSHILYSELADGLPVVSILDVSKTDSVPLTIASGVFAVWSFE